MAIAAFLPLDEPTGVFRMVEHNTLIQHGGWMLIALALGIAASGYRVSQGSLTARWVPIILCVIAAGVIVLIASSKIRELLDYFEDLRTGHPVGPDGNPPTTQPGMVANLGIAIYVAGAGVAAALAGALMLRRKEDEAVSRDAPTRERSGRLHERADRARPHADRARPHAERLQERLELEAEAEVAEAEARAAEAQARAIRLRREAEAKAKPAPSPQSSKPPSRGQNPNPPGS